jgi:hypothetical protein
LINSKKMRILLKGSARFSVKNKMERCEALLL